MTEYMLVWNTILWLTEHEPEATDEIAILLKRLDEMDEEVATSRPGRGLRSNGAPFA